MKSTIVIKSNPYKKEVKYFWKNDNGTLSDLAEEGNSPFSKSKPDYMKLTNTTIADIAGHVVKIIDEKYNRQDGVHIEVEGVEADYVAVKKAIETELSGKSMDCKWKKHMKSFTDTTQDIKRIYRDLSNTLSECDDEGIIKLCNENDERGWLQFEFNMENVTSASELYDLCGQADNYLENITKEIKEEIENKANMVVDVEQALEKQKELASELNKIMRDKILLDSVSKLCKEKKIEFRKQFDNLLTDFFNEKLSQKKEEYIKEYINEAVQYVNSHQKEWLKSFEVNDKIFVEVFNAYMNASLRMADIEKVLITYFNKDLESYVDEMNLKAENFWNLRTEELKCEFAQKVYDSCELAEPQKDLIRQYIINDGEQQISYSVLDVGYKVEKDNFYWAKQKKLDEKAVWNEYESKLKVNFENKKWENLKKNDKITDNMESMLLYIK